MLNEMEARLFWEAYENGASTAKEIGTYILAQGYGVNEIYDSFIKMVERYAERNLGHDLPRGTEIP